MLEILIPYPAHFFPVHFSNRYSIVKANGVKLSILLSILICQLIVCERALGLDTNKSMHSAYTISWQAPQSLNHNDVRFDLVDVKHSTRFFTPPDDVDIHSYLNNPKQMSSEEKAAEKNSTMQPNFIDHPRYWFSTDVINRSDEENWVLHVSNFVIEEMTVVVITDSDHQLITSNFSYGRGDINLNPIGRGFPLQLEKNTRYTVLIEFRASRKTWPPYIGLMSKSHYDRWSSVLHFSHKISIGIITGIVIISFLCFFLIWDKAFLWFGLCAGVVLVASLQFSSVRVELFGFDYSFKTPTLWMLGSLAITVKLLFAYEFLRINRSSPYLFSGFCFLISLALMSSSLIFFFSAQVATIILILLATVGDVFILCTGIYKLIKEGRYYLFYVVGWGLVISSSVAWFLMKFIGVAEKEQLTITYHFVIQPYIQMAHILIHAIAIFYRIKVLKEQKQDAERVSQSKSKFIASSSHDLRQPLHSMRMLLSLLKEHINTSKGQEIFQALERSHSSMDGSFKSIMDLTKIEAGEVVVNVESFPLNTLLDKLRVEHLPQAQAKNLEFSVLPTKSIISTDPVLLERMLRNLITNALYYTDKGKVLIGCRRRGPKLAIQVYDTGCGIKNSDIDKVFDIYQRAGETVKLDATNKSCMGIGLSVVKQLSDLLDHKVSVQSQLNHGTLFEIEVPMSHYQQKLDTPVAIKRHDALNIALFSSDERIQQLLKEWRYPFNCFSSVQEFCKQEFLNHESFNHKSFTQESFNQESIRKVSLNVNPQYDLIIFDHKVFSILSESFSTSNFPYQMDEVLNHSAIGVLTDPTLENPNEYDDFEKKFNIHLHGLNKPVRPSQLRALINYALTTTQS